MKKFFLCLSAIFILFIISGVCFSGCDADSLSSVSKNLSHYDINLDYNNDTKELKGIETLTYINNSNSVFDCLYLHLYPRAFTENSIFPPVSLSSSIKAYPNGKSYAKFEIIEIDILNEASSFEITGDDENILKVNFEKKLYPNEKKILKIKFNQTLPNINHRYGYGNNAINLANFYPIACVYMNDRWYTSPYSSNGDPFFSDMANYDVSLSCDSSLIIANTGYITNKSQTNQTTTTSMQAKSVRDFAIVLSDKFKILTQKCNDVEVKYYYYNDKNPTQSLKTCVTSLKTFNNLIGKYPYKTLSIVETNFVHGGMEYPNLVYISDSIENYADYQNVIIHEIAHQWWYGLVGNDAYESSWVDEGLTEFTTAYFYKYNKDYEKSFETIMQISINNYSMFVDIYGNVYGEVDTSMNRKLCEYNSEPEYVYNTYVKGMLLFDSIYQLVGEKKFNKALNYYFDKYKFKNASPEALISAFETATGFPLENMFYSWINGKIIIQKI